MIMRALHALGFSDHDDRVLEAAKERVGPPKWEETSGCALALMCDPCSEEARKQLRERIGLQLDQGGFQPADRVDDFFDEGGMLGGAMNFIGFITDARRQL
jgi:hypothetical protein